MSLLTLKHICCVSKAVSASRHCLFALCEEQLHLYCVFDVYVWMLADAMTGYVTQLEV